MSIDIEKIRNDFPMLKKSMHGKPLIYFDSAATAQKPQCVIDKISDFYENHYSTVHRAVYELAALSTSQYNAVREKIRNLLNAKHLEEIVFTKGTTESINLVAYSFGKAFIKKNDVILVSQIEHHANIVPWQIMCEDRGAILKVIPVDDSGDIDLEAYKNLLELNPVKLVAITHISNAIGTLNPIKEIISTAHLHGALVLVDGAQSTPHIKIDVQDLNADFFVFSGHKFYGPTGVGVLYGKKDLLNSMPPYQGGGDMIDKVSFEKTTYNTLPLKFEAGTPLIAEVLGLGAAIDYIEKIGFDFISDYENKLLEYATKKMKNIPHVKIIGNPKEKGAIISFSADDIHPLDIGTMLDLKGIAIRTGHHCSQTTMQHFNVTATARISFAFYNTFNEIDYFAEALREILSILK